MAWSSFQPGYGVTGMKPEANNCSPCRLENSAGVVAGSVRAGLHRGGAVRDLPLSFSGRRPALPCGRSFALRSCHGRPHPPSRFCCPASARTRSRAPPSRAGHADETRSMKFAKPASCWATNFLVISSLSSSVFSSNLVGAWPTKISGVPNVKALRKIIAWRI
jgi:hypothetical protein